MRNLGVKPNEIISTHCFFANRFSIGLNPEFLYSVFAFEGSTLEDGFMESYYFAVGSELRFYIPLKEQKLFLFLEATGAWARSRDLAVLYHDLPNHPSPLVGEQLVNKFIIGGGPGISYFISPKLGLELRYNIYEVNHLSGEEHIRRTGLESGKFYGNRLQWGINYFLPVWKGKQENN